VGSQLSSGSGTGYASFIAMAESETVSAVEEVRREISVGCVDLPHGMSRRVYFQKLRFLETRLPADEVPSERIMRRWRNESGGPGRFAIVAPRDLCEPAGPESPTERAAASARASLLASGARHAGAAAVLFMTPPSLTPSSAHRDRLRRLFEDVAGPDRFVGLVRVWQPDGLWRPALAARVARELDVVAACDPLAADAFDDGGPPPPGDIAYARVGGMGRPSRPLGDDDLARLAEWLEPCQRGFVSFDTPAKLRDAQGLARWVGDSAVAARN
jgi:uncharacterized protein YecE (DUF72 family)